MASQTSPVHACGIGRECGCSDGGGENEKGQDKSAVETARGVTASSEVGRGGQSGRRQILTWPLRWAPRWAPSHDCSVDISFTTDSSIQVRLTHINTMIVTLQNLNSPSTGCPAASTTLCVQQKDLQNGGTATPAPLPSPQHPHPPPLAPQRSSTLSRPYSPSQLES